MNLFLQPRDYSLNFTYRRARVRAIWALVPVWRWRTRISAGSV